METGFPQKGFQSKIEWKMAFHKRVLKSKIEWKMAFHKRVLKAKLNGKWLSTKGLFKQHWMENGFSCRVQYPHCRGEVIDNTRTT